MKQLLKTLTLLIVFLPILTGCEKFLDEKQNQSLITPGQVQDLQSLLDNNSQINNSDVNSAEISADNYFLTEGDFNSLSEFERNMYVWNPVNLFEPGINNAWVIMYAKIYKANVVLYEIEKIDKSVDISLWNNLKGQALFLRAKSFLQVASVWSPAYDSTIDGKDLGIPLRLDPNFNTKSTRSSVHETYSQIVSDLKLAIPLLPESPIHVFRASKAAVYGMLARTYLFMREYRQAGLYADSCLQLKDNLMDYNIPIEGYFDPSESYPFTRFNPEVIYEETMEYPSSLYYGNIAEELYRSYDENDLRKAVFFNTGGIGPEGFRGDYDGSLGIFAGLATDEVILTRAECYAREGNLVAAMTDLNTLMIKRWKNNGTFVPFTASDPSDALKKILTERRKELLFRRLRWMDIKRLNKENAGIVLTRILEGKTYRLAPNDLRYALPIPEDVIKISGMPQNPR